MSDLTITHTKNDAGCLTITLGGRLAIDTVATLHELLKEQSPAASTVLLDTDSLQEIDLTGMQLVCSACWSLQSQGATLSFSGPQASCITQAIANLGLDRHTTCKHKPQLSCIMCGGKN